MDIKLGKHDKHIKFKNLRDLKQYMIKHRDFKKGVTDSMNKGNWSGVYSYDDYLELLENGDQKVMDGIHTETKKAVNDLTKKYKEVIRTYKFDVTGEFFDVGLVMTGVPETWLQPVPEEDETLRVELILNGTIHDDDNLARKLVVNCGRVLGMVKILEDHGVEVRITQLVCAKKYHQDNNGTMYMECPVKNYDEPINYKKCSALVSLTYLRRAYFKVAEVESGGRVRSGYGLASSIDGAIKIANNGEIDALEKRLFKKGK